MSIEGPIQLAGENISIGGSIEWTKCSNCDFESEQLALKSDTDMVYAGVVGLTDLKEKRIVVTRLSNKEWNDYENHIPEKLQQRINKIFNTDSFVFFDQKHFLDKVTSEKIFRPICPKCSDYLIKAKNQSFDQYIRNGGQIISLDVHEINN